MKIDKFVTETWQGTFELEDKFYQEYASWIQFERELDPEGHKYSTTQKGWQRAFSDREPVPSWFDYLQPTIDLIKTEIDYSTIKSSWIVEYDEGGYQDPHLHNVPHKEGLTIIINLQGEADLLLFDPRATAICQGHVFADIVALKPGIWVAIPTWLVHSSRPCKNKRSILVIDTVRN